jgi:hypothetical protein
LEAPAPGPKGDAEPKVYGMAVLGGILGSLVGTPQAIGIGAYLPCFIYHLGVSVGGDERESQGMVGFARFLYASMASAVPGLVGMVVAHVCKYVVEWARASIN